MDYYREYIEVTEPSDGGPPYTAEVRLCHDFPVIKPGGGNTVVVFDQRVGDGLSEGCREDVTLPTDQWVCQTAEPVC